jgi:glycosyltransferase involved in cell wall biosynthesis
MTRPIVWVFAEYYLPAYLAGGPIRSLENLINAFGDQYEFRVITRSHDHNSPSTFNGVRCGVWTAVGMAHVFYLQRGWRGFPEFLQVLGQVRTRLGAIYLNTFFSRKFSILPILLAYCGILSRAGILLAPRGELSPGALKMRTRRKRAFLFLAKRSGLYNRILWQASSRHEAADIRREFPDVQLVFEAALLAGFPGQANTEIRRAQVLTASDLIVPRSSENADSQARGKKSGAARVVFIGRIVPNKNLSFALQVIYRANGEFVFDIYGPAENASYWKECCEIIAAAPSHVKVAYRGVIESGRVPETLARSHLLLLPTFSENFGHVIAESLLSGVPVLISDMTPWRDLVAGGVGWDVALNDPVEFTAVLSSLAEMNNKDWHAMSERARRFAESRCFNARVFEANAQLLSLASSRSLRNEGIFMESVQTLGGTP